VIEGEAPLPGLEPAEHRDVDARSITDLLQGQTLLEAKLTKASSDSLIDRLWTRVCLHGKNSCARQAMSST